MWLLERFYTVNGNKDNILLVTVKTWIDYKPWYESQENYKRNHTLLTSSRMHFSSLAILPRQAWQILRFLSLFLDVTTSQNRSSSTEATRKSSETDPCFHVSCFEQTQLAPNTIWSKNESEKTTMKTYLKLYTLFTLYTLYTLFESTITKENLMEEASRGIIQDGGHSWSTGTNSGNPTSPHTNPPRLTRRLEQ